MHVHILEPATVFLPQYARSQTKDLPHGFEKKGVFLAKYQCYANIAQFFMRGPVGAPLIFLVGEPRLLPLVDLPRA